MPQSSSSNKKSVTQINLPPSRVGKKGVTFYLEPDVVKQLRTLSINEETTLQALMVEATNMLFRSRGKEEIAK